MTAPFVIVGAGVAGLALGLALKRRGIEALVLERRPALPAEGAGIQIGPNGTRCLRALGVFDAMGAVASEPVAIVVHDGETGRELTQLPLGDWIAARHGAPYWVAQRRDLVQALYTAAVEAGVEVRFGVELAGIADISGIGKTSGFGETSGSLVINTVGDPGPGAVIRASCVVGADGVWSRVRRDVFGGSDAVLTGKVAARALVIGPQLDNIRRDAVSVWMAKDTHLVCYPVERGRALTVVLISNGDETAARWSLPVDADEMRRRFMTFPNDVRRLVDVAGSWQQWPLVTRKPLENFAFGRAALVGDAAHPMLPFLAQGAVMALEDALSLAEHVADSRDDIPRALTAYSDDRVMRTQRVVKTAAEQGRIYHLSGTMRLARDTVLRLTPPTLMMRRYDWLYGGGPAKSTTKLG